MRFFWSLRDVPQYRVLLVESGSRHLIDNLIPSLRRTMPEASVDLLTCYGGVPATLPEGSRVYRVGDYQTPERREELLRELRAAGYTSMGLLCSNERVMTKWKWMIGAKVPAKIFIVNENGDYFWFDRSNFGTIRHFVLFRMGLTGAGALRTAGRLLLFPFSVLYLLLYAFVAHLLRALRLFLQSKRA